MSNGTLYAVVQFEGRGRNQVRRVVVPFPDAHAADLFALENGYGDYAVASVSSSFAPERATTRKDVSVTAPRRGRLRTSLARTA